MPFVSDNKIMRDSIHFDYTFLRLYDYIVYTCKTNKKSCFHRVREGLQRTFGRNGKSNIMLSLMKYNSHWIFSCLGICLDLCLARSLLTYDLSVITACFLLHVRKILELWPIVRPVWLLTGTFRWGYLFTEPRIRARNRARIRARNSSSDSSKIKLVKKDFTNFLFGVSIWRAIWQSSKLLTIAI
jgi:hypothetical protein